MTKAKPQNTGKKTSKLNSRRAVRWFWVIITAPFAVLLLMLLLTAAGLFGKLPTFEELENPKSNLATEIYSEDGKMMGTFFVQNRSYVDYSELNDSLVAALVSTEDMRYYSHSGIDFISLARVGFKTIAMGRRDQGGGSTITQQLAKNLFPRDTVRNRSSISKNSRLVVSKLKEWITAVKLEHNYTKEEIIAMYLNTVEFGSNAFGIKSAARTFFNKLPEELTVNESAMLIGVVNAPTKYSPKLNPDNAIRRRNTVLARMEDAGFISKAQLDSLVALPIVLDYKPVSHNEGHGTYFREMLRRTMTMSKPKRGQFATDYDYEQELRRWENDPLYGWCEKNTKADGTPYNIYRDGLKIYTTINSSMQQYAEQAVIDRLREDIQPAMDGQIKRTKTIFLRQKQADIDKIVGNAMRYSDRYFDLQKAGASDAEIENAFSTAVPMKLYSYKGNEIDTVMTPRDSIIYYKSLMRASFMAMDPRTGHVKAYVGGPNFRYFKYDMVKQGKRQVGSTIKPFIYTFAIDHLGLSPCTPVPNLPVTIETETGVPWQPKEASGRTDIYDGKDKPLRWGLANSRNNFSAWIMKQSKQPIAVADFIHRMGVTSYIDPVYALCLGTPDVSLYEMVGAYSVYANKGVHTEPIFVTRIEDRHGNLLAAFTPATSDAISEQTAYTMLDMMKSVITAGTAGRLRWQYNFTGDMAGKTGTSQENRDAWFIGVTPQIVAGAWVGGEDQSVHLWSGGEGGVRALPIFGEFMKKVYANPLLGVSQEDKFQAPSGGLPNYSCTPVAGAGMDSQGGLDEFFD